MYRRDALLMGWVTWLTGRLPYECPSCGWRGWWAPRKVHPTAMALLLALETRLTQLGLPRRASALKGAALIGVLGGVLAALIALTARATTPSDPVADVALPPAAAVQPQPIPPASPPAPEAVPVALTSPAPEAPAPAAAPTAPTSGKAENAVARKQPRPQPQPPLAARIAGYRGGLEIDSDPDGARVLIDGEAVGFTPLQLKDLPVGSRVVRVEAEGYATWTTAARVVANQRARVSAVLQRSSPR